MFLYQPISGYCYNSDSIFLYDFITQFKPKGKLLDIGCGVGIISLLLTRDFETQTYIIDKQKRMLDYAVHNFLINGLKVTPYFDDFTQFQTKDRFDFIVSNPPFYDPMVTQSKDTYINIARYTHHLPIGKLIKQVKTFLKPRGWFVFCYDAKQIDLLMQYLREYGINPEKIRFVHSKIDRESKLVMIAARNNSKSMTQVLPPLVIFDEQSNYLFEAIQAFGKARTHSIKGDFGNEE
ncbi:MAG: methyltransferase [Sulfurovum sp.]|nr:methyltransferase [Sulfurovum sp.]MCB4744571.1 methyltransferase [Sulfurovum sp.]MCB4746857.1 methyltransferase [Sulfurovum sp.]MCB4747024.1 methyltransferase [Sulfurovum sp.]MCB4748540.1 methyltransferase [Sulfurovum sp.]